MPESLKLKEMSSLSINKIVDTLSNVYIQLIKNNMPLNSFPSVMLWGQPGVGKSQGVREIKEKIEKETKKNVVITDVRLLLLNPIDLRGIPVSNAEKSLAIWLKPKIFDMNPNSDTVNILFLDEISAAPQSVQAAAYQLTLDRKVGEHELPNNCIVIAAGNRVTDKSVAYKMPKALANRLLHFDCECDFDSWKEWAIHSGINEKIIGFLSFRPDLLNTFNESGDSLAFATPRSWEFVSNILNNVSSSLTQVHNLISGLIGTGIAFEFESWCNTYKNIPNIEDIFNGKTIDVPKETSELFAVTSGIINYAKKFKNDSISLLNCLDYIKKLPKDFSVIIIKEFLEDNKLKEKCMSIPEFLKLIEEKSSILRKMGGGAFNGENNFE